MVPSLLLSLDSLAVVMVGCSGVLSLLSVEEENCRRRMVSVEYTSTALAM